VKNLRFVLTALFLLAAGCGSATGGSEAGNPSRSVAGLVVSDSGSSALKTQTLSCPADAVVIQNTASQDRRVSIAQDCSFQLSLPALDDAYTMYFLHGEAVVSSAMFQNSPDRFSEPIFVVSEASTAMDLGRFVLNQETVAPESPPAAQNDRDQDGIADYEDLDDDNDGVTDKDERDCDLDGIIDDFDVDADLCDGNLVTALQTVLDVFPHADAGVTDNQKVPTDTEVRARFSCPLYAGSIDSESFVLSVPAHKESFSCLPSNNSFSPSTDTSGFLNEDLDALTCIHAGGLEAATIYEARIQGLICIDGTPLPGVVWQWKTSPEALIP
jgi:hypothetical protein